MGSRLELQLSDVLAKDLEEMASAADCSKAEVIKKALALYGIVKKKQSEGARFILQEGDSRKLLAKL